MATMDKLMKALEALKVIQPSSSTEDASSNFRKKETTTCSKDKILHCSVVADAICSHSLRSSADFPKVLGLAMDTFLLCCDDENSDVRLMADECLNRTIKSLLDSHLGRLLVELFKEIKKCGPSRSLRAALSRFGDICHLMRPQKCRPYTVNLIPALVKICQRKDEESVQETLAITFTKLMPVLGQYTNDKDIKTLLKVFLPNLTSNSAIIRRAAATSLTCVCQYSRRPASFFSWLLLGLFDIILPVQEEHSVYVILGVLVCMRYMLPHLNESMLAPSFRNNVSNLQNDEDVGVTKEMLLKVYEISLHFCHHSDHNVVTSTLETLYQLLKCAPNQMQQVLVSPFGITKSWIFETPKLNRIISESQNSILPTNISLDESALVDELDEYMPENKADNHLSYDQDMNDNYSQSIDSSLNFDSESENSFADSNSLFRHGRENYFFGSAEARRNTFKNGASDEDMLDTDDEFWGLNTSTPSPGPLLKTEFKVGNIGAFTDSDIALKYCTRLLCSSFLLNGSPSGTVPDRNVKVSVKSLAFGCLSYIFSLYPNGFFLQLYIEKFDGSHLTDSQRIWDVILYSSHPDPHIRGQAAILIGHLLASALRRAGGSWSKWVASLTESDAPALQFLLSKLLCVVKDDSSLASRLGLLGLKQCSSFLLNSMDAIESFHFLDILLSVKNNAYWLTKVELAELISSLPFKAVHYLEFKHSKCSFSNDTYYQDKMLKEILISLLGDEDARVRLASAKAFLNLIPELFFPINHPNNDTVTAIAKEMTDCYLDVSFKDPFSFGFPLVHALVKPFSMNSSTFTKVIDTSLSRIIDLLVSTLRLSNNKYLVYGCCNALSCLAEKYSVTAFPESWAITYCDFKAEKILNEAFKLHTQCSTNEILEIDTSLGVDSFSDLLCHLISLVTNTSLCLDLIAHQHALHLVGNLLCGVWYRLNVEKHKNSNAGSQDSKIDSYLSIVVGKIFLHVMRLLNIYTHVLEEQYPISHTNRTALPSLPNAPSLSPIKRKNKTKDDTPTASPTLKGSPIKIPDKIDIEKERSGSRISGSFGLFHSHPLYMKLFDILRGTYCSYKISMDFQSNEKFCQLLHCCLEVMCQILEICDSTEMGKNAEEILCYLKSIMVMEPSSSVQCVRQLLKCLFGTNLMMLCQEAQMVSGINKNCDSPNRLFSSAPGLYYTIISHPYSLFTHALAEKAIRVSGEKVNNVVSFRSLNWVKKGSDKVTILLKSGAKLEKSSLANHIRLFEGVVIKSLQQYTISSDVNLQCEVLDLLAQLVQLRVNYCLLDADQVFISHVLKQFEYIEEGQIPNAEALIGRIFYFLILLSYERFHSKMVVTVPQILQHCDRLIASGQSPEKYVVPALKPVIEDLFLLRSLNKMDVSKELDAQREVIVSQVFKLVNYAQVLELFSLLITHSRQEGEDKWKKTSRQVVDAILPLLSRQQIAIENQGQLNLLHKLLEDVASNVFRPVDILLKALFFQPRDLTVSPYINRWMCMILAVLRILISQANEEAILSRLEDMGITVKIYKLELSHNMRCEKELSENVSGHYTEYLPSAVFARFLFQVLGVVVESLCNHAYMYTLSFTHNTFLCQQAAHLLLYLTHMFQSGTFRSVTNSAMGIIKNEAGDQDLCTKYNVYYSVSELEIFFHKIAPFYPTLVIQWCNLLTLLNYDSQTFWSTIVHPCQDLVPIQTKPCSTLLRLEQELFLPCNLEMVHRGGIILLCDYMCDNPNDVVQMTWLIVNHVNHIIDLSAETTVLDFLSAIHRNPAASGLWIQAIISAYRKKDIKPTFWKKALNCLENIHPSQSGKLLSLLIDHFIFTHHILISNLCDRMACKKLEFLISDPSSSQLTPLDIERMVKSLETNGIVNRHRKFLSLCEKLKAVLGNTIDDSSHPLSQHSLLCIQDISLTKEWYTMFVKKQCYSSLSPAKECAHLLSNFKYEDIVAIMISKDFQLPVLEHCLELGSQLMASSEKYLGTRCNDPFVGVIESPGSALYRAAQTVYLQHLTDFASLLPKTLKHLSKLHTLFTEKPFWEILFFLVPCSSTFLSSLDILPDKSIPENSQDDIILLSIICCKAAVWHTKFSSSSSSEMIKLTLLLLDKVLKKSELTPIVNSYHPCLQMYSCISSIHHLINYLLQDCAVPKFDSQLLSEQHSLTQEESLARNSCIQIVELIDCLEKQSSLLFQIPEQLFIPLKSVIKGLSRLPLVNSFARTPPILWSLGWKPELSGDFKTTVPPPPGEYLQDRDVLKQYIYRINVLGWITRQQFEETWMALLGVLSATPVDDVDGKEEDQERIRTSCLAVKSITSLLLQTLLLPQPGNPHNSQFLLQPRDKPLAFQHTKCGKKLMSVRLPIYTALQQLLNCERVGDLILNINPERISTPNQYSLSQVSLEYLNAAAGLVEDNEDPDGSASSNSSPISTNVGGVASFQQREQSLSNGGLDIHSCLHFLLDLYSQWLSPQTCPFTPLMLLTEVTKSVVALSDIFMEKAQFEWMLDTFLEVQRIHPAEDEMIAQYLIFGICKAAAVLGVEQDLLDRLKKLLELNLKSTFLPTRISSLHGILYLLEQGGGDDAFPILPTATEYVLKHFENTNLQNPFCDNEEHVLMLWAVTFYIMENYHEDIAAEEFPQKIYEICHNICVSTDDCCSSSVYLTVLHGLERLLVAEILTGKEANVLLKLTVDRIRSGTPITSLAALGFFLSCMYIGKSTNMWSNELVPDTSKITEKTQTAARQIDAEFLLVAMERVTTLFDRVKKAYPFEADIICEILPSFLMEFFPVQEVLNKIITEFLSSQQPHSQIMAKVIFEVFQYLHKQSQEEIVHEWVLLSLSNFMQRSPLSIAVWSLSCFLISATANHWFQALFPHVQNRMGKMEEEDKILFCIAGVNFRNQLQSDEQKQAFFNTIRSVALPHTPYADLLQCL
ncbi:huntingtin [Parasteatoda tepidariorum]|nr:huntingtin [Parasteatoda tepidariorum]